MKKTIKLVAVVMVIAMLALSLVACAKTLRGSYSSTGEFWGVESTVTYSFDGKDYTKTTVTGIGTLSNTNTETGTYEIVEDPEDAEKLVIKFTTTSGDNSTTVTYSFKEGTKDGTKYIEIDGNEFLKD